jgi:hypothetical protein
MPFVQLTILGHSVLQSLESRGHIFLPKHAIQCPLENNCDPCHIISQFQPIQMWSFVKSI